MGVYLVFNIQYPRFGDKPKCMSALVGAVVVTGPGVAGFNHCTGSFTRILGRFLRLEPSHNVSRPDMCCLSNDWTRHWSLHKGILDGSARPLIC